MGGRYVSFTRFSTGVIGFLFRWELFTCSTSQCPIDPMVKFVRATSGSSLTNTNVGGLSIFRVSARIYRFSTQFPTARGCRVAFPGVSPNGFATLFLLAIYTSLRFNVVCLFVGLTNRSQTIYTAFNLSTSPMKDACPFNYFRMRFVIVLRSSICTRTCEDANRFLVI